MNVIAFQPSRDWRARELQRIVGALTPMLEQGHASRWEVGTTEAGDPQLYVLGPQPEEACEICISRIGRTYVLEDGEGRLLCDTDNLALLAERVATSFHRSKLQFVARMMLTWCVVRQAFHEKVEPLLAEGEEMFALVAPQLAALA